MGLTKNRNLALAASLEAISFQVKELMFKELTAAFENVLKDGKFTTEALDKANIAKIVKMHTNVTIKPVINEVDTGLGAHVEFPQIDINHPLINEAYRHLKGNVDGVAAIRAAKGAIKGRVRLDVSRVEGIFAEIENSLVFSKGLFSTKKFSAGELAAVLCHELGHIFTYFEFLALNVHTNHVLSAASTAMMKTASNDDRFVILREVEDSLSVKLADKDALAKANNADVIQTVILSSVIEKSRSELGSNIYDMRCWEALCDQFAARHGASRDLATALDKIMRFYGHSSYMGNFSFTFLEVVKFSLFMTMVVTGIGASLAVLIIITNPMERLYDEPGERIKRIRLQVVEALKDDGISNGRRESLLSDLKIIDNVLPEINDRRGVLELFWTEVIPYGRRQQGQKETQQALEQLVSNDLFVKAAQFKTLKV